MRNRDRNAALLALEQEIERYRPFLDLSPDEALARSETASPAEKQILEKFWDWFESDSRFITFNGRQFDGPFLMIRSAIHGLTPKRDLVGQRYELHPNCDLREVLNFYGTPNPRQYKFNLDLACKAFGVETSKGEGLDGRSVETWYRAGRHREIAEYCMDDVRATAELYEKLAATLLPMNFRFREAEMRSARNTGQMALLPTSESTFIESIAQTSKTLAAALEREPAIVSGSHEAIVLEKLIRTDEPEELP